MAGNIFQPPYTISFEEMVHVLKPTAEVSVNILNVHNLGLSRCKSKMKQIKLKHQILKQGQKGTYMKGERDRKRRREGARKGGNKEGKLKYPSRGIQL